MSLKKIIAKKKCAIQISVKKTFTEIFNLPKNLSLGGTGTEPNLENDRKVC